MVFDDLRIEEWFDTDAALLLAHPGQFHVVGVTCVIVILGPNFKTNPHTPLQDITILRIHIDKVFIDFIKKLFS